IHFVSPATAGKTILSVTDAFNQTALATINIINMNPLTINPSEMTLRLGEHKELSVLGGKGGYTWTVSSGTLLTFQGEKVTYIAPDVTGEVTVTVKDSAGETAESKLNVSLDLSLTPQIVIVHQGDRKGIEFTALGGTFPLKWNQTSGTLTSIQGNDAQIMFTPPMEEGESQIIVQDARTTAMSIVKVVSVPIISPSHITMKANELVQFKAAQGKPQYTWSVQSGDISQTTENTANFTAPTKTGNYEVILKDSVGNQSKSSVNVIGNLIISPVKVIATVGDEVFFSASRGQEPYVWESSVTGRYFSKRYENTGQYEVTVKDASGNVCVGEVLVIDDVLQITPEKTFIHPGEVVNFFVDGGSEPYEWATDCGTLSNHNGKHVGYISSEESGIYEITVIDGRGIQGKAEIEVSAVVSEFDGIATMNQGYIRSEIMIDGISRKERKILTDQHGYMEFNFSVHVPNDKNYSVYALAIYTPPPEIPDGQILFIFKTGNSANPFYIYTGGDLPVYAVAEAGSRSAVNFYEGLIKGVPGTFDFYIGYCPIEESWEKELMFNPQPFSVEIK
ncbi:MAG: hypothetical protein HQK77_17225, partial [Desulfobacterales bacterium]|nr:hypothetical protein [Desulfobacterales bacterium]